MFWNNSRTFYNLSKALGSFGFLPLRGAGTGFVVVLPLSLIFDPPLYILHFTIYTTFHREATLKTALELLDYSVKIRSQVQTITRAILHGNQSPSVSNSQRGRKLWTEFWQLEDIFKPLGGNELIVWKTDSRFFFSRLTRPKTLTPRFTDFCTDFEKKTDGFAVYPGVGTDSPVWPVRSEETLSWGISRLRYCDPR